MNKLKINPQGGEFIGVGYVESKCLQSKQRFHGDYHSLALVSSLNDPWNLKMKLFNMYMKRSWKWSLFHIYNHKICEGKIDSWQKFQMVTN